MVASTKPIHNYASINAIEELTNLNLNNNSSFYCPITQDIMTDPVLTVDGHSYERAAIEEW